MLKIFYMQNLLEAILYVLYHTYMSLPIISKGFLCRIQFIISVDGSVSLLLLMTRP